MNIFIFSIEIIFNFGQGNAFKGEQYSMPNKPAQTLPAAEKKKNTRDKFHRCPQIPPEYTELNVIGKNAKMLILWDSESSKSKIFFNHGESIFTKN